MWVTAARSLADRGILGADLDSADSNRSWNPFPKQPIEIERAQNCAERVVGFIEEMTSHAETTLVCRDGQSIEREMWNVESHTRPMHPNGKVRIARSFQKTSLMS